MAAILSRGRWVKAMITKFYGISALLQHHLNIMTSQITSNLPVCSGTNKENIKAPHYWPFVRRIQWWLLDSPHKGPLMQKSFPYHDVIMYHTVGCFFELILLMGMFWVCFNYLSFSHIVKTLIKFSILHHFLTDCYIRCPLCVPQCWFARRIFLSPLWIWLIKDWSLDVKCHV